MSQQVEQEISSRPTTRRPRQLSSTQVMFAVILAIALMLAVQFSSRITEERRLNEIRDTVEDEIDLLRREQTELVEQLDFVGSDAYVEDWARRESRMVRDNMVLVIPISANSAQEQTQIQQAIEQTAIIETTLPEPESWTLWWALFFDMPPPA